VAIRENRTHIIEVSMRFSATSFVFAIAATISLSGCETTGPKDGTLVGPVDGSGASRPIGGLFNGPSAPVLPPVDNDLAVACQEAAGDKYFMDPDLVRAVYSSKDGGNTLVTLKVDTRDALCTLNGKGKVTSVVDTSPKSADQIAAEEQKAADIAAGKVPAKPDVKKVVKKKKAKVAAAAPKIAPVLGAR
jgi:hypothetical protein